jgi:hypothetical protein
LWATGLSEALIDERGRLIEIQEQLLKTGVLMQQKPRRLVQLAKFLC